MSALPSSVDSKSTSKPPPPVLPKPLYLLLEDKCIIEYIDTKPARSSASTPTIVLVHGSPGTYRDFRYLIPLLQDSARVIGINLPGVHGSKILDRDSYYDHVDALGAARLVYEALTRICEPEEDVFLAGHSFGGHTAINLAAINAKEQVLNARGMILLASAGHRPHRAFWPIGSAVVANAVRAEIPTISSAAKTMAKLGYTKVVGFPGNAPRSYYVSSLIRSSRTDFELISKQIKELAQHTPAFVAWAKDDVFVEEAISVTLSRECHPGPRLAFETGGHNIQKTHASVLAKEIRAWTREIVHKNRARL